MLCKLEITIIAMQEEIELILDDAKEQMNKTIDHLDRELGMIRAGKANPKMLEGLLVDYFGSMTPLSQISNINTPDPRTIAIKPWEKSMINPIEKAIMAANLGMNPDNNGDMIRINVPPLTEERRRDLVKQVKKEGEEARIGIRSVRRDAIAELKKLEKDGASEDVVKDAEGVIQKIHDAYMRKIDELLDKKEKDVMTV